MFPSKSLLRPMLLSHHYRWELSAVRSYRATVLPARNALQQNRSSSNRHSQTLQTRWTGMWLLHNLKTMVGTQKKSKNYLPKVDIYLRTIFTQPLYISSYDVQTEKWRDILFQNGQEQRQSLQWPAFREVAVFVTKPTSLPKATNMQTTTNHQRKPPRSNLLIEFTKCRWHRASAISLLTHDFNSLLRHSSAANRRLDSMRTQRPASRGHRTKKPVCSFPAKVRKGDNSKDLSYRTLPSHGFFVVMSSSQPFIPRHSGNCITLFGSKCFDWPFPFIPVR